jgi:hypothetical protein
MMMMMIAMMMMMMMIMIAMMMVNSAMYIQSYEHTCKHKHYMNYEIYDMMLADINMVYMTCNN